MTIKIKKEEITKLQRNNYPQICGHHSTIVEGNYLSCNKIIEFAVKVEGDLILRDKETKRTKENPCYIYLKDADFATPIEGKIVAAINKNKLEEEFEIMQNSKVIMYASEVGSWKKEELEIEFPKDIDDFISQVEGWLEEQVVNLIKGKNIYKVDVEIISKGTINVWAKNNEQAEQKIKGKLYDTKIQNKIETDNVSIKAKCIEEDNIQDFIKSKEFDISFTNEEKIEILRSIALNKGGVRN